MVWDSRFTEVHKVMPRWHNEFVECLACNSEEQGLLTDCYPEHHFALILTNFGDQRSNEHCWDLY